VVPSCSHLIRPCDAICPECCDGQKSSSGCQLCPEWQTRQHVLNHCSVALERLRYNQRHDDVLWTLFKFISSHLQPGHQVTADLPGEHYCLRQDVATTDSRPDIVIWSDQSIILVELTIPFQPGMDVAAERKQAKYADLLARCLTICHFHLITIEVGSPLRYGQGVSLMPPALTSCTVSCPAQSRVSDGSWKPRSPERSLQDHMTSGVKETGWAVDVYVTLLHT